MLGSGMCCRIKEHLNEYYKAFDVCNSPLNKGELTPFVEMFLKIIDISHKQLYSALEKRVNDLERYSLILKKLLSENSSAFNLYFVLVQATLFSNNGITVKELKQHFEISENTMRKMLRDIPKNLLVIDKNDREYHYLMNLSELDSFFHSTEFHKMDSSRNG